MKDTLRTIAIAAIAGIAFGLVVGWRLWHPEPRRAVVESAAPAVTLQNGVQEIQRQPTATPPVKLEKAVKEISPKARLSRVISIDVKPNSVTTPATTDVRTGGYSHVECTPVHIDAGLVDLPDGSHRVIVDTNGTIVKAIDIPTYTPPAVKNVRWAVGGLYTTNRDYGAFVDRDLGPFRIGVDMIRLSQTNTVEAIARIGVRF